ncbi:MAG: tetratricopeptide repeat protein [Myxococcota bacterium]
MATSLINTIDPNAVSGTVEERDAQARPLRDRANAALRRGDLARAMLHASDALMLNPNARDSLELVDKIANTAGDPLSLVPLSVSIALTACRARVLALQGDLEWAMVLVRHVVTAAPALECVAWIRDWLTPAAIRRLGLSELKGVVVMLVKLWSELPAGQVVGDARLPNVRATADVIAQLRAEFPDEVPLYLSEILVRRRLGEPSATLVLAHAAVERFPSDWGVLVSVANAERDARHPDKSLDYARRALAVTGGDGSPLHDAAWAYLEAERPAEALELFEELLDEYPDYPLSRETRELIQRLAAQR